MTSTGYSANKKYTRRIELTQGDKFKRLKDLDEIISSTKSQSAVSDAQICLLKQSTSALNRAFWCYQDCCKCCNCSSLSTTGTAKSHQILVFVRPYFFFSGDCNDPSTNPAIKQNFIGLLSQPYFPPRWCKDIPDKCNEDSIDVYCGNVTAAERRRRRSPIMQVSTS